MTNPATTTAKPWTNGTVTFPCDCGGEMIGTGSISTGETLANGYTPQLGEVISIDKIQCAKCGDWQTG